MKKAKRIYLAIIVVCIFIIAGSVYYVLGGFDEVRVYSFDGAQRTVIGKHYIGKFNPRELRTFMREAMDFTDSTKRLTLVEYQNDTIGQDSSHYFIGFSFDEIRGILSIPSGYTYEEYETNKIYRVFITQHPLVRPLPEDIRDMMEIQAINDGKVLQPYTFDLYYQDGSWCTEGWTK